MNRSAGAAGCTFLDYDRDGHLDLSSAITQARSGANSFIEGPAVCQWKGHSRDSAAAALPGDTNVLYHNNGDGTFTDVSEKSGILKPGPRYSITAVSYDFDNDGWPDIYVAVDSEASHSVSQQSRRHCHRHRIMAGCAYSENGHEQGGMGVGVGDYDCDGWFDISRRTSPTILATSITTTATELQRCDVFPQASESIIATSRGRAFIDYDNDGWRDLMQIKRSCLSGN